MVPANATVPLIDAFVYNIHGPLKLAGGGGFLGLNRPKLPLYRRKIGRPPPPPKSGGFQKFAYLGASPAHVWFIMYKITSKCRSGGSTLFVRNRIDLDLMFQDPGLAIVFALEFLVALKVSEVEISSEIPKI